MQVWGEIDRLDENFNNVTVQTGDTVPVTVSATAYGISADSSLPNKINELSLWAIKIDPGPPHIGDAGTGGNLGDGNPDEAPHTVTEYVYDNSTNPNLKTTANRTARRDISMVRALATTGCSSGQRAF